MNNVKKQYGIWTGIAMVVGIVIGSGVFLKAGGVLQLAGGDLKMSILAWFVGGVIMIASGFCFAVFATKVTKYNGVIDYIETATNKKVGYFFAWLFTTFYYPIVASIVALFAAQYFFRLFGIQFETVNKLGISVIVDMEFYHWPCFIVAFIILILVVVLNYLSPMISSKFQISATVIKLIPIGVIAIAGLFASFIAGSDYGIINAVKDPALGFKLNFGEAVKKTAFAYEGWVCATAINAELKDSKKNLPRALVGGTIAILLFYIIYYISLSAFLGNAGTILADSNAPIVVFEKIMGKIGGAFFTFFIMVSCLGTVNGVSISCCRGMYTMSCRGQGICPEKFAKLGKNESVSLLSCLYGLACMILMLGVWFLATREVWLFKHLGSMDEIVCAIIYGVYITMYVYMIKNFKDNNVFSRYVMPIVAIIGSLFFVICGTGLYQLIVDQKTDSLIAFLVFMGLFALLMFPSIFFYKEENNKEAVLE